MINDANWIFQVDFDTHLAQAWREIRASCVRWALWFLTWASKRWRRVIPTKALLPHRRIQGLSLLQQTTRQNSLQAEQVQEEIAPLPPSLTRLQARLRTQTPQAT